MIQGGEISTLESFDEISGRPGLCNSCKDLDDERRFKGEKSWATERFLQSGEEV